MSYIYLTEMARKYEEAFIFALKLYTGYNSQGSLYQRQVTTKVISRHLTVVVL